MNNTDIEYLDYTCNPFAMRCTPVSEGCRECWHLKIADRLSKNPKISKHLRAVYEGADLCPVLKKREIDALLRKTGPAKVGMQFMGDLFHESIRGDMICRVFQAMAASDDLDFLLLTKRTDQMRDCIQHFYGGDEPPKNLWIGATIENENHLDRAITVLLTPAAIRWISFEPLLGPIDPEIFWEYCFNQCCTRIDWVVIGCESGAKRRPCKMEWMTDIVNVCKKENTPVFVKQVEINGKVEHDIFKFPKELQIREFPKK